MLTKLSKALKMTCWLAARNYFEHVTDPDLVDFAILSLQAAEKRYEYLWKKMKENGY
jgi:hypothetical protein